jgi:hypothetical protein
MCQRRLWELLDGASSFFRQPEKAWGGTAVHIGLTPPIT